jgi:hypothetical protein
MDEMAKNWNCQSGTSGSLPDRISTESVKRFMGYMENPSMTLSKVASIINQNFRTTLMTVPLLECKHNL